MTQVIMDATPLKEEKPLDPVLEKHKKKYNELIRYYEELEVNVNYLRKLLFLK